MEGDVAMPRSRNAMKCYSFYDCRWEKSPTGLVEVPYNIDDYFRELQKMEIYLSSVGFCG